MQKIVLIVLVVSVFTACKSQEEQSASTAVETIADSMQTPEPPATAGKLAATATDEVEGKEGKTISFTYDNNASTVSFELDGKQVVLTSIEKISDMPAANGRTYSNEEFTYNNKDGIKLTDKKGKLIFEEKQ